jgi:hypothetical protein
VTSGLLAASVPRSRIPSERRAQNCKQREEDNQAHKKYLFENLDHGFRLAVLDLTSPPELIRKPEIHEKANSPGLLDRSGPLRAENSGPGSWTRRSRSGRRAARVGQAPVVVLAGVRATGTGEVRVEPSARLLERVRADEPV